MRQSRAPRPRKWKWLALWPIFPLAVGVFLLFGCASEDHGAPAATNNPAGPGKSQGASKSDDFLVVDCLLPGQIRRLGTQMTYLSARQAIKTSARDCEIRGGEYVSYDRANYATALKVWLPLAEQGDAAAQTNVGEIFEKGLGVPPDYAAAAQWYRRAAEGGSSRAAINLGNLFEHGLGVPKDPTQALNWYRRAAGLPQISFEVIPGQTGAEAQQMRAQIADLRSQLQAKRAELDRAQGELETKRRLEREAGALREKLAGAEAESSAQRAGIERLTQQAAPAGPKINLVQVQLLEPEIAATTVTTRDIQARPTSVPAATSSVMKVLLVGKVVSDVGVKSLTINGKDEALDREHLFRSQIPLTEADRRVRIVAVDRNGRSSTLNFVLPAVPMAQRPPSRASDGSAPGGKSEARRPNVNFGTYHALVIGNINYRQLPSLRTAADDATEVAKILRDRYQFKTTLLIDATRYQILSALNDLREKLTSKDNLLIYYAGHGILDAKSQRGYWLPVDAEPTATANWIANGDITAILNTMTVRQLLLVSDSCYAGTLSRSVGGQLESGMTDGELFDVIQKMAQQRSRLVMTSGGLEPVLDSAGGKHSAFADVFIQVLQENNGVLLGREVFRRLQIKVASMAERPSVPQLPEYAPIQFAGHEAGDFVFVRLGG